MTDLAVFADPRSVAVVGASADPAKWGWWLARGALRGAGRRRVDLVNARGAVIEGVRSHRSIEELPHAPELVVLATPAATVPALVERALDRGAAGFLAITGGIDVDTERRLTARVRAAGARLVGPNCLGIYDAGHQLDLVWGRFTPGQLAIVSQSGQLGLEIAGLAARAGLGVSRFVSIGNQVDVSAAELLDDLAGHDRTRAVLVYLEDFGDGRELLATLAGLRAAGKPVVVLTVGESAASRAVARSHTGALTAGTDVVAAACRAAGAVLAHTPAQAVELAGLLGGPRPAGRRVAVVSDSGGQAGVAADTLARHGLLVPPLDTDTTATLAEALPAAAATANPIDLAGAGERDLHSYVRVVDVLVGSGEVDAVVLTGYFGCYGEDNPQLAERELAVAGALAGVVRAHGRPLLVHSMCPDSAVMRSLRAQEVSTAPTIDALVGSLSLLTELSAAPSDPLPPPVPAPGTGPGRELDYLSGRALLAGAGIGYPAAAAVRTPAELPAAAAALAPPYVLKAGWLAHKTEVGGVLVGLPDAAAAAAALGELRARLGDGEYVLEEQDRRPDTVELIVGGRRDSSFGPVVLVGMGGVAAELYRDTRVALAPVEPEQARAMIAGLRGFPLLDGWRGRPAVDLDAAAAAVSALSHLIAREPHVLECEINPLRVGPHGALAVDALVVTAEDGAPCRSVVNATPSVIHCRIVGGVGS